MARLGVLRHLCAASFTILFVSSALSQSVTVSPTSLAFGNQAQGSSSTVQKVTLKNGQKTAITISSIGTNLSDYSQTNTCPVSPATLAASATCTISVTFKPSAQGARNATLAVVDSGVSSPQSVTLTGTGTAPTLLSIAVTPSTASVAAGYTQQFAATGTYSDGSTQNLTSSVTWTSSSTAVATINTSGLATSVAKGTATMKAASGKLTGSATLTVSAAVLTSISVTPVNASVAAGNTQQFAATGTYSNGTTKTITSSVTWSSSSTSVATVNSGGLATSLTQGTTTITASSGTISEAAALTVTAPTLSSIAITPATASVVAGLTQQFLATGTYSNGTTQNLSGSVTWSSSSTSVATINTNGLATGVAKGSATIKATSGAINSSAKLTVSAVALTSISITPASASVAAGLTEQFTATGNYNNGTTKTLTSATWSSSATSIATVNSAGLATGLVQGTATITASSGTISGSALLGVTPPALAGLTITPSTATVPSGTTAQFAATGTYSNGSTQNLTNTVNWSVSPATIATITAAGLATGTAPGTGTITGTDGAFSATASLTVGAPVLVAITVTPGNASFALGTNQPLTATGTYSDGSTLNISGNVQWSSANASVAAVNAQGVASGVSVGNAAITATSGTVTGTTTVTVSPAVLVTIAVTPAIPTLPLGTTQPFTATGTYTDGSTQNITTTVQWSSDTVTTATISNVAGSQGVATSEGEGTTTITATMGSVNGSTVVTVTAAALVSVAVTPGTATIALGTTQGFTATGTYTDGSTQNLSTTVQWSSDTVTAATISNNAGSQGVATSVAEGTATISATQGGVTGTAGLTVTAAALVSIAVTPPTATIALGTTQSFTALGTYTDGTTQDVTGSGHWSSTASAVAVISNTTGTNGVASTVGTGTTTITITSGSVNGTATLVVNPAALVSIAVTPQNGTIALGTSQQYAAVGTYTDGSVQDVTTSVQWNSSSATVAVISNTVGTVGLATSSGQGTTNISATLGTVTGTTTLTVGAPAVVSITVTPSTATIPLGTGQQYQAIGTFTDGSTQDLTNSVVWSSDTSSVAVIGNGGAAVSVGEGGATITATYGSVNSAGILTVSPPVLVSLAISPSSSTIPAGTTQQFTAIGTYSNGSVQDLTSMVNWISSNPSVATVNASGFTSSTSVGAATITASLAGISAGASLTVGAPVLVAIAVTPGNASFALGTNQPLTATGTYSDGSTLNISGNVQWSSANASVAAVNAQGVASGVSVGNAAITATSGTITGTTTVTVSPAVLVTIAVTPAIPTLPLGTTQPFTATGTYTDGSTQNITTTVQWSSDTVTTATISNVAGSQGVATSEGEGTATITATMGSVSGSTVVTVTAAALVSIAVTPGTATIALGTTQGFTATGTYTDGSTQNLTTTVQWSSDTGTAATISNNAGSQGVTTSVAEGTATISATQGGVTGTAGLTVTAAALVSIAVTPPTATIALGTTQSFTALGTYTDGTTQDVTQSGHWSSTASAVAVISNTTGTNGVASTVGTGTTTITITSGSVNGTATLMVNPAALVSIAVTPQNGTIALGTSQQYAAVGTYTDGSVQDVTTSVQWNSSSAMVAVISNTVGTVGLATSSGQGTTNISATLGTVTGTTTLTVGAPAVVSITVTPSTATIPLGTGQQYQAIGTFTDGSTQDLTNSVVWSSSVLAVATVSASGAANSISVGTAIISASYGGTSAGASLFVSAPVPVSLQVTPTSSSIAWGTQQQFQAFLTYNNGTVQNATNLAVWSSSAVGVATISSGGLATGVGAGNTSVYANAGDGLVSGAALTVAPPALVSISITPTNTAINLSQSQQFTATGTYADQSQQNLSGAVSWSSSNNSVVGLNNSGVAVAMGFGTANISATAGSVTGSTSVTVPTAATIPASFFDMTINKDTTPWPTDSFYGERLLGTGTLWGDIETASGAYSWTILNKFVADAKAHNVDLVYTFLGVPSWASSNPSDTSCSSWNGSCDPPSDLNADGTGANAYWDNFVTAIATQVGTSVKYWELWDEPNVAGYANPKTWTTAQWIRMASDARQIILGINPNAKIVTPGIGVGTAWLSNFLAAGGGQYVDIIAFHGYANPPETAVSLIQPVQAAMTSYGLTSLPLWDTEASWGLDTALPDLDMQAGSVARLNLIQAANGVARLYWYGWDFSNRGTLWQPNTATGCTTASNGGYICPAGIAYGQTSSWMVGAVLSGCSNAGTIWTCTLARPGGYLAQVMWDSSQSCSNGVCQTSSYTFPPEFIQYRDLWGNTYSLSGTTTVPLGAMPVILENQ